MRATHAFVGCSIRDDRLQMRTIGAAHFNRDPLAHARSPSLAEHTLVRDSYVRFNPLKKESDRAAAVLCAAFLDHELEQLLKRFMRGIKETHQLFQPMQPLVDKLIQMVPSAC